ncbi:toll/interleukin-1 receptor domain-containing protein [Streptomyces sp. ME02-6978a]|uniref:toll/interleukin-1 receptor domain-containing protein n=1 Tax=unclassified Streptomyces TaxID=2593676 RepID=UPI0029A7C37E|nr:MULTISPECIES: toll/interleukin-1 receptor domain-containing protein [unclassified Streptomyces]MDX3090113.1 toll/interleukin-1 receptor domain-containing protein [Streptomyces sp. ME12-02E]MDX3333573.1 toll/interleukin-1 receptor domain-containing protein [Streptomyces sp. ME02-6978a]
MPEIFINYRTGDGGILAAALDEALRHRFGDDAVFRDGRSIPAGATYPHELLTQLHRSQVLLAVMGPGWAAAKELRREDDWVRREILEARDCRIPIVPVLADPSVRWLRREELPPELAWLAELQALRFTSYHSTRDLAVIGDELMDLVPDLADRRTDSPAPSSFGTSNSTTDGRHGLVVQGRDFSGDIAGTVHKDNIGPFHTGSGDQFIGSPRISGDGTTYVSGTNNGDVGHAFGGDADGHHDGDERR